VTTAKRERLDASIERVLSRFSGVAGFAAKNLTSNEEVLVSADQSLPTASVIKVAILAEVFRQAQLNVLDLDERLPLSRDDIVGGSGILKALGDGLCPTIRDLATLMVIVSDNTATNMLIERVGGVDRINETMKQYGLESIILHNRVDFLAIGEDVRRFGEARAYDLMRFNEMLHRGEIVDASASRAMIDIMRGQQYLDQVPRYLRNVAPRPQKSSESAASVACKTGFFPGTHADAGLIYLPDDVTIAYCMMTHESTDVSIGAESEGAIVNGVLGRLLIEYWWPSETGSINFLLPSPYVDLFVGKP
jgi:beta-lactamase class A